MIGAIVTDIEGTTSSIRFVRDVLFPYAAEALPAYVREHRTDHDVRRELDATAAEAGIPSHDTDAIVEKLLEWIREDVKATPLKSLQGMIWESGYRSGVYQAHVYADAVRKLHEWYESGIPLYVYSSGSVRAQQLFFRYSVYGDIRRLISGWFDTTTGPKKSAEAYRRIASEIGLPPGRILFLSDVTDELDAARDAGFETCLLLRPGDTPPDMDRRGHPAAASFDEIRPEDFG